ncbi:FAD-linked oxidoreductase [Colletotrichum fructicola]|uniref:FAD binding domain-containing protein n=2 Tax=Colletotrichum fructicola (strain Nara gc5) TaxID=1213859 RepID=L2FR28_COLFN|nr:FAD-linked oxidoreductase [Colletotrichum fructicola]KAE9566590.1 FAD-linked oxidoreductase [Colletotrichum fructicola]KAF4426728.1 FAD-linked oxidoreductase ZEB1 [Colletotrichum fructicola]
MVIVRSTLICLILAGVVAAEGHCKVYPGDDAWPSDEAWASLNARVDNRLLKPRPQAAACYPGSEYDAAACATMSANWNNSYTHLDDPIEMFSPVYSGLTCLPPNIYDSGNCSMGGYPWYVINATSPKHIQEGVRFAKETGIRLVVKNTGHDFSGKSGGGESLSIWTHYLKDVEYIPEVTDETEGYAGAAFKCGTGVQAFEIYELAHKHGKVVVGGEGQTVGVMGGYIQGGGHSPLSSLYGTGADQALAFEVVTADGNLITADHTQNSDLFWALRGGGGSTFGVATSVTVKVFPDMTTTAAAFKFSTADGISNSTFWAGVRSYFDYFIDNADAGTYSYFRVLANNPSPGHFTLQMSPFLAPNKTLKVVESLLSPWLTDLADMGIKLAPNITEYDSFYPSWKDFFPLEGVAKVNIQSGSRLFPRKNFESEDLKQATFDAIRKSVETNHVFIGFNMKMVSPDDPDNAVNPAWRDNILFAIQLGSWSINATADQILKIREEFTHGHMQRWRDVSPGAGSYLAESDRMEPNFQQSFYGDEKYPRLLELKRKWDPEDVFYAATAVGSEFWTIETADGLPHENGRLCRVEE